MHPDNDDRYEVKRLACHACRAIYEDVDRLVDPKSHRFMYHIPQLEED